jgi:probable rRNA maturation factor
MKTKDNLSDEKIYISVTLSNDSTIKELNKKYLKKNSITDVLSFEINEKQKDGTLYLGDVVVNKDQAKRQARDYDNTVEEEISDLVAHGVLHLLGVHHENDDDNSVHGIAISKEKQ